MGVEEEGRRPVRGFVCVNPACVRHGQRLKVRKTRPSALGIVTRYRWCPACSARQVTEERRRPRRGSGSPLARPDNPAALALAAEGETGQDATAVPGRPAV